MPTSCTATTIPYPRGLHGADVARAARRHRPHHSVELSAADLRPHRSAARSPPATPAWSSRRKTRACRCCASPSSRRTSACPTARSTSSPASAREAGAALAAHPRHRSRFVHRLAAPRARGSRQEAAQAALPGDAGARRQRPADRVRRRRPRRRAAGARQRHRAERRPDLLGGQPPAGRAARATRRCSHGWASASPRCRSGPALADLDCGPLIRAAQLERVRGFLADAERDGIATVARGDDRRRCARRRLLRRADAAARRAADVPPRAARRCSARCSRRCRSTTKPTRCGIANGTDFGLVAGVWTRDGGRQLRMARAVRSGQVFINNYGAGGGVELPFGGVKSLGLRPREGLRGAVRLHRR